MAYKNLAFNVMLDEEDKARLDEMSIKSGLSKGQVLRGALENAWMMKCREVPMCANGFHCMVPQMHQNRPAPQYPNTVPKALVDPAKKA